MQILRPNKDNMAGVLLVSQKLMVFEDMWRHNANNRVEVTFSNYIHFLAENLSLISYFQLQDLEVISQCKYQLHQECLKLYPFFVRDVTLAYVAEILDAAKKNKEITEIAYVPPSNSTIKKMKASRLPETAKLMNEGRRLILEMEAAGRILHISKLDNRYQSRLDLCLITLGYTLFTEKNLRNFTWILY